MEKAIETNNTIVIISLVEELMVRDGLSIGIREIDHIHLKSLLQFIKKKIDSSNTQNIILELYEIILEECSHKFRDSDLKTLLSEIKTEIEKEIENCKNAIDIVSFLREN